MNTSQSASQSQSPLAPSTEPAARVIPVTGWLKTLILQSIPFFNMIFLLIWAFSDKSDPNLRNHSRAVLLMILIGMVVTAIVIVSSILLVLPALVESGVFENFNR